MPVNAGGHRQTAEHIPMGTGVLLQLQAPTACGVEDGEDRDLPAEQLEPGGLHPQRHPGRRWNEGSHQVEQGLNQNETTPQAHRS
jgi:hypothetical protein